MVKREIHQKLSEVTKYYPAVFLTGSRQSGKTTLAKEIFPKLPHVLLENPDTRALATHDPRLFLSQYPKGAILDEILLKTFFYEPNPNLPDDTVGVFSPDIVEIKLHLYPNPASGQIYFMPVGLPKADKAVVRLYDLSGRVAREIETVLFNGHQYIYDIFGIQPGYYLIQVEGKNYRYKTEKILIQ